MQNAARNANLLTLTLLSMTQAQLTAFLFYFNLSALDLGLLAETAAVQQGCQLLFDESILFFFRIPIVGTSLPVLDFDVLIDTDSSVV